MYYSLAFIHNIIKTFRIVSFSKCFNFPLSDSSCRRLDNCSPNADCVQMEYEYECQCRSSYTGDGYTCTKVTEDTPKCIFGVCICPEGFVYQGMSCKEDFEQKDTGSPKAVPDCYGTSCACPKGYKFNTLTQTCDFSNIPIPAQGKAVAI